MMTAGEALKRSAKLEEERYGKEFEEAINKAIDCGSCFCCIPDRSISEATERWLKSLGYKVELVSSKFGDCNLYIRW